MRSSKPKIPSLKEASNFKPQAVRAVVRYPKSSETIDEIMLREDLTTAAADNRHPFDFEERTAKFGEAVVRFVKRIPFNPRNDRIISQLVGASTSIGANYCEASEAVSKKDFRYSISRSKKEAKETKHFLRMAVASEPQLAEAARVLYREAHELLRICNSMYRK
jgi:four helix bundle protein